MVRNSDRALSASINNLAWNNSTKPLCTRIPAYMHRSIQLISRIHTHLYTYMEQPWWHSLMTCFSPFSKIFYIAFSNSEHFTHALKLKTRNLTPETRSTKFETNPLVQFLRVDSVTRFRKFGRLICHVTVRFLVQWS